MDCIKLSWFLWTCFKSNEEGQEDHLWRTAGAPWSMACIRTWASPKTVLAELLLKPVLERLNVPTVAQTSVKHFKLSSNVVVVWWKGLKMHHQSTVPMALACSNRWERMRPSMPCFFQGWEVKHHSFKWKPRSPELAAQRRTPLGSYLPNIPLIITALPSGACESELPVQTFPAVFSVPSD